MENSNSQSKPASILFKEYLDCVNAGNPKTVAEFFDKDGYIEAPYVATFGMDSKILGRPAIEATMTGLLQNAPNFKFTSLRIILETPIEVVAEYESEAVMATGKDYKQLYIGHITFKDGKIVTHKEFLNTVTFAKAFLPDVLKDLANK
ncbi:nuclear transport factor 2 family protein [Flavobacterium sp.]|uniref:nuclear transport factor 2 family protein n=1 Tax=Flavobacterium sp. TaxID=239 RepID=UPI003D104766